MNKTWKRGRTFKPKLKVTGVSVFPLDLLLELHRLHPTINPSILCMANHSSDHDCKSCFKLWFYLAVLRVSTSPLCPKPYIKHDSSGGAQCGNTARAGKKKRSIVACDVSVMACRIRDANVCQICPDSDDDLTAPIHDTRITPRCKHTHTHFPLT